MVSYLKYNVADIALVQETHMMCTEAEKLKQDWVGQVFHNSFNSKRNGVGILVHKRVNFVMIKQKKDDKGRLIWLEAIINGQKFDFCNIYAPNKEDSDFFSYG